MHHCINLSGTSIFNRTTGYVDRLVNEGTEIHLNKNTLNRQSGFILNQAWSPIIKLLMEVIWGLSRAEQVLDSTHQPSCLMANYNRKEYQYADRLWRPISVLTISFLMVRIEMGLEMFVDSPSNHLTWLLAQEYFIEFSNCEIFKLYMKFLTYLQPQSKIM